MLAIFIRSVLNQLRRAIPSATGSRRQLRLLTLQACLALLPGIMMVGNAAAETPVATQYAGGDGSELKPWQIADLAELRLLSETSADWVAGTFFIVTANIDAADTETWNAGAGFSPIGKIGGIPFEGGFDGNGKVISGLFINRPPQQQVGLFGGQKGGTIKNTHLTGCSITGKDTTGGLVGQNRLGAIESSTVLSCSVSGDGSDVGGLVGFLENGTITASQTSGTISSMGIGSGTGGLVGSTYQAIITSSSSSANVDSDGVVAGGLIGFLNQSKLSSSSALGNVQGSSNVGGLVGRTTSPTGNLTLSHASGTVTGIDNVGG